ncbi:MAG: hypothetical protein IJC45_07790 [Clostridia bacterium]|nr:hypothetical protein [Clostridia bacterium]
MQKTMKKTLTLIFMILMIATSIPLAFAASDGEPLRIDVSAAADINIGAEQEYYDEDGYILTGTSETCSVDIRDACNITLQDAKFRRLILQYAPYDAVFNINLVGENEVEDLSFSDEHLIFESSETASFKTEYFSTAGNDGTVTVNSGNVIADMTQKENFPGISCNNFIINGGTVTVSNDYFYTVLGPIELNGGTLNVINTSSDKEAIIHNITMNKGALLTVRADFGIIHSNYGILPADSVEEGNSFFVRYDTTSSFVPVADIAEALAGKTYAEIKIDAHEHGFTDGTCATCGLVCTHTNYEDAKCTTCGFVCSHANYDDGTCTECGLVCPHANWTDCVCDICEYECLHENYTYNGCGICGFVCEHIDGYNDYPDGYCDNCGLEHQALSVVAGETKTVFLADVDDWVYVKFVPEKDAEYIFFSSDADGYDRADPRIEILQADFAVLTEDDDTDNYHFEVAVNLEAGKTYWLHLGCYDDESTFNVSVRENLYITHQPTQEKPYVRINVADDASYQWYTAADEREELVAAGEELELYNTDVYYSAQSGWHGHWNADDEVSYFYIYLEKGETVTLVPSTECELYISFEDNGYYGKWTYLDAGEELVYTAEIEGWYEVDGYSNNEEQTTVRAYLGEISYTEIEGETEDTLSSYEYGKKYACEVTFSDGVSEMSEMIDMSYRITHHPTAGEPYVELNCDTDAAYQWYTLYEGTTEITDENAQTVSYDWGESSYDEETGWTGVPWSEEGNGLDFFTVALEAGDTVRVELTGDFYDGVGLYDYGSGTDFWQYTTDGVTTYDLMAEIAGNYTFYTYVNSGTVTVQAYFVETTESAIDGETDARLENAELGTKYACEVIFADGTAETSAVFEYVYAIAHQPTFEEPYVTANEPDGAAYQWYTVTKEPGEITDVVASGDWSVFGAPPEIEGTYDEENGWYSESGYYFVMELEAGEQLSIEVPDGTAVGYIYGIGDGDVMNDNPIGSGPNVDFTAPKDGYYGFFTEPIDEEDSSETVLYMKAYTLLYVYTALEGETESVLSTADEQIDYSCEVTFADGSTAMSDIMDFTYKITRQPTADEMSVAVNNDTNALYQWYTVEIGDIAVTDEIATGDWSVFGAPPEIEGTYDEENGWYSESGYYFVMELEAGDQLTFDMPDGLTLVYLYGIGDGDVLSDDTIGSETKLTFTAPRDGFYGFGAFDSNRVGASEEMLPDTVYINATIRGNAYTPVDGATESWYLPEAIGTYACEVTFGDGTKEMSDTVEITELHTCDFTGTWQKDAQYHWKECTHKYCFEIAQKAEHAHQATVTAPTCTVGGYTTYTCTCGDTYTADEVGASGHNYTKVVTAPTITSGGYTTYTCACGDTYTADEVDPIVGENAFAKDDAIIGLADTTVATLLEQAEKGAKLIKADGTDKNQDEKVGTGDKLVLSDNTEIVISVLGDINGDGAITTADARLALRKAVGLETFSEAQDRAAKVDGSKEVEVAHARKILRAAVGLEKAEDWYKALTAKAE